MDGAAAVRPVVGLFGAFDTGDLGEVALRRVVEGELRRRRPDVDLIALAPFGAERPIPGDDGRPAMPLPPLATGSFLDLDALIITGNVLGEDRHWADLYPVSAATIAERGVAALMLTGKRAGADLSFPVEWFAVGLLAGEVDVSGLAEVRVSPRDPRTIERFGGEAAYTGDPLLLAGRVFEPETLRRRAELLRMCGALPSGRWMVLEVAGDLAATPSIGRSDEAIAAALGSDPTLSAVIVCLTPTRQAPGSVVRVPPSVAERVHYLPAWVGLDDIAASISGSAAVVATTAAGAHIAASLGIPVAGIDIEESHRFSWAIPMISADATPAIKALLAGTQPVDIDSDVRNLDGMLTRVAAWLPDASAPSRPAIEVDPVESAIAVIQQRLVDERTALQAELSRLQAELEHLQASPEHRIARPIREGYQRWQRRRT